ncbi:uncharacterized protein A4U43_C03F14260 [Asparagus officinalis]|uniref:Uncharacterized protein n=1 Tax=Asparagus officinalis TaxID=4686 RepID=A0A5P1F9X0_ASPOF|nr:uncharacterized protein A4U43_C03F14260 [Asparagus officinalis]
MMAPVGLEYPYPHRVTKIGEEEWDRMGQYHIGSSGSILNLYKSPNKSTVMSLLTISTSGASLRASRGVDSEHAAETIASRASEIDKLRRELDESNGKGRRLDKTLQERDHAKAQVEVEKQAVVHAKH